MKHLNSISRILLVVMLLVGARFSAQAQTSDAVFKGISVGIQKGDADAVAAYFNNNVEVTLPGVDKTFSAKQAVFVLRDFFAKHPPQNFKVMHKGHSGATFYETGVYMSSKGEFDTNIFLKKIGDKFLITQIRFEAD